MSSGHRPRRQAILGHVSSLSDRAILWAHSPCFEGFVNVTDDVRAYARELAARSLGAGEDTRWFEELYSSGAAVPWVDLQPNPLLADRIPQGKGRALVVGCGLGDDAEYVAAQGWSVTAFDIAPTAIAQARARWRDSSVQYVVADAMAPPEGWVGGFDLVVEAYTVQVLCGPARSRAALGIASCVAPEGTLVVIARRRGDADPPGQMPWPLSRAELDLFEGLTREQVEESVDGEGVDRWVATYRRRDVF